MPPPQHSRLYLPKIDNPPRTILEYLIARFPNVHFSEWQQRVADGLVSLSDGNALRTDTAYRHGLHVFYRRHVASEPQPLEEPSIVYRDEYIVVADKPHGMPATPAGDCVERSLLLRVQAMTGLPDLAPVHRLDRETAGLLLLAAHPTARARYHALFAERRIAREYEAVARVAELPDRKRWRIENRIGPGDPWYRQRIVDGPVNAITEVEFLELTAGGLGRFRLLPHTGKKHQLRVHMTSLGWPILGDPFYPVIRDKEAAAAPLQLLAARLTFDDPISGQKRTFTTSRILEALSGC